MNFGDLMAASISSWCTIELKGMRYAVTLVEQRCSGLEMETEMTIHFESSRENLHFICHKPLSTFASDLTENRNRIDRGIYRYSALRLMMGAYTESGACFGVASRAESPQHPSCEMHVQAVLETFSMYCVSTTDVPAM